MPWFKAKCNIRVNGKRYLAGSVVEIDAATSKLNDNFIPCDPPAGQIAKVTKKTESKAADPAPVKSFEAPPAKKE